MKLTNQNLSKEIIEAHKKGGVKTATPVGIEKIKSGDLSAHAFVFEFGELIGYLPSFETGMPIFKGDLWDYLSLNAQQRKYVEKRMINVMATEIELAFMVKEIEDRYCVLSRKEAIPQLDPLKGDIEVKVIYPNQNGAWCYVNNHFVFIPREEVFYGNPDPRDTLAQGEIYTARIYERSDDGEYYRASIKMLSADPWEAIAEEYEKKEGGGRYAPGTVRKATVIKKLDNSDSYLVAFAPGVLGTCNVPPLREKQSPLEKNQMVSVRIKTMNPKKRLITGHFVV